MSRSLEKILDVLGPKPTDTAAVTRRRLQILRWMRTNVWYMADLPLGEFRAGRCSRTNNHRHRSPAEARQCSVDRLMRLSREADNYAQN